VFGVPPTSGEKIEFPGRVNVNTAEAPVLKALFGPEYEDQVDKIVEYRLEKSGDDYVHDLSGKDWYKSVPGFRSARIDPNLICLTSDLFRIKAVARVNETRSTVIAVVHRHKEPETKKLWCKVLNWQVK
jgi:general secretion pathway protein K